MIEGNNYKFLY